MWNEKINPRIVAEEQSFLHLALKIGQLGCVCSFILIIVSNTLIFLLMGGIHSYILFEYCSQAVTLFSIITSILLAIGYYALLRSNMSRLALPYVFLSLITYEISWTFLLSLGMEYYTIFSVLNSATYIIFTLILTWIKWTINQTVSDRGLLHR
jgi:hypothetical protein